MKMVRASDDQQVQEISRLAWAWEIPEMKKGRLVHDHQVGCMLAEHRPPGGLGC